MELSIKILADFYAKNGYLQQQLDAAGIVRDRCYQALCRIQAVLEDDSLDDLECFRKIEEIVCIFEGLGAGVDYRHDFG